MKTTLILAIGMAAMFCAPAALDSTPAPSNVGNAEYPRIAPDRRVTFRLKAPKAQQVQLHGGAGLVKDALDLVRGDDGVWTVTTPPAVPGFHSEHAGDARGTGPSRDQERVLFFVRHGSRMADVASQPA